MALYFERRNEVIYPVVIYPGWFCLRAAADERVYIRDLEIKLRK